MWKVFPCLGTAGPYDDIIQFASYERLYQNILSNKIKLKLPETLEKEAEEEIEEEETPQFEYASSLFSLKMIHVGETPRIEMSSFLFSPKQSMINLNSPLGEIKEGEEP